MNYKIFLFKKFKFVCFFFFDRVKKCEVDYFIGKRLILITVIILLLILTRLLNFADFHLHEYYYYYFNV